MVTMANISMFQPEDESASLPMVLPHSFVALRNTEAGSESFFPVVRRFLEDEERKGLKKLRGFAAADAADFLDGVRKPIIPTI